MKHANVAIFVPHVGCPNQCSFCNQRTISGSQEAPTPAQVTEICAQALTQLKGQAEKAQIAFFGGSFTAIPRDYMESLLRAAQPFLGEGRFSGIRLSTRPDAIDEERLRLLLRYGVTSIELGVQSMDDAVLLKNRRGHTAQDVRDAVACIRQYPQIELGLQMMLGLAGDTVASMEHTARCIAQLHPDTVRIYPTLVLHGTELAQWYQEGRYQPLMLDDAAQLSARFIELFEREKIRVIRVGLHASTFMEGELLAGPYHPAFRELCESKIFFRLAQELLYGMPKDKRYHLLVAPNAVSKMVGQSRENLCRLKEEGYDVQVKPMQGLIGRAILCEAVEDREKGVMQDAVKDVADPGV